MDYMQIKWGACLDFKMLGKRVRFLRKMMSLTQENLAEQVGLSSSFLGHIERGSRKASLETLVSLANALRVDVSYLLADSLSAKTAEPLSDKKAMLFLLDEIARYVKDNVPE